MNFPDYYKILGISHDASDETIRQAYRSLAKKVHPDITRHPSASAAFQLLNDAYHTLIDPERRYRYDLKLKYADWYDARIRNDMKKYGTHKRQSRSYTGQTTMPPAKKGISRKNLRIYNRVIFITIVTLIAGGTIMSLVDIFLNGKIYGLLFFVVFGLLVYYGLRVLGRKKR